MYVPRTHIARTAYCPTASAPTIANANIPTPQTSVYATSTFTCNGAYQSTGFQTGVNPNYVCLPGTTTTGVWSIVTYGCQCM